MRFDFYDEEDGLSNHWLESIAQDHDGYLWIGTQDGLNRFDGYTFKVFRHNDKDSTSILKDYRQIPVVDKKGRLWLGYIGGGLSKYNPECQCFTHLIDPSKNKEHFAKHSIRIIRFEDSIIWYSAPGIGLNRYDLITGKHMQFNLPNIDSAYSSSEKENYNSVSELVEFPNNIFWLTSPNGLYTFDKKTFRFSYKKYGVNTPGKVRMDRFGPLVPEKNQGLWLGSYTAGLSYYDILSGKFTTYKYDFRDQNSTFTNVLYDVSPKDEDELWLATPDKGFGVFNKKTKQFDFWNHQLPDGSNMASLLTFGFYKTRDNAFFILTNEGFLKYNPNSNLFQFHELKIKGGQYDKGFLIEKIIVDPEFNASYFGTRDGNGLQVVYHATGESKSFPVEIKPDNPDKFSSVNDLLLDELGRLWIASNDYLYEFDRMHQRMIKIENPLVSRQENKNYHFKKMVQDESKTIWVLTNEGKIFKLNPETKKLYYTLNSADTSHSCIKDIDKITFDKQNRMWVFGDAQIGYYDLATEKFTFYKDSLLDKFLQNTVCGFSTDTFGNIWIAAQLKGLLKITTTCPVHDTYEFITSEDELPTKRMTAMDTDPNGNIWISTIMGVVYLNSYTRKYTIFNQTVGMNKQTLFLKFLKNADGTFYISAPGKYCQVDLQRINHSVAIPKVYIDKFKTGDIEKPIKADSTSILNLKPDENFFSFEFSCIDFTNQSLNKFAYKLENWDKNWVYCGNRRYANYTNLNGGEYTLYVKAANSQGSWSQPVKARIFIATHFYKTNWFVLFITSIFALVIYRLYSYRISRIEREEKIKTEFNKQLADTRMEALRAQMNPHFIFNCLNSINRYIIKSDIKTSSLYITRFAKLIRLILDNSEHKKVVLSNELEALKLYIEMEALRFDHKFTFDIQVDDEIDTNNIEVPPLIIQPYVENAIWHGLLQKDTGGSLFIRLTQENDNLICEITDNGIGREKAMEYKSQNAPTRKSIGIKLTEERLNMASEDLAKSGSQKIIDLYNENGEPAGTTVILNIPI